MIISQLIEILKQLPQDSKIMIPHYYRSESGGFRQTLWDISSVNPCYDQDTNKIANCTIKCNIKIIDVK